jgi:hypothetical protein
VIGSCSGGAHPEGAQGRAEAFFGERGRALAPFAFVCVALLGLAALAARRVASFEVAAHARGSDDFDRASRLDPGDVGLRLVAAESWIAEGRCDRAAEHLAAVARFSPASPALGELEARCTSVSSR